MVASKQLRLAVKTEEERRARLEKMVATTQLRLDLEKKSKKRNGFDLDLIWV